MYAVDASTGLPKTGDAANIVLYVAKDDGTVTAITSNSGVPTECDNTNAKGDYKIALSSTEVTADKLRFTGRSGTSNVVIIPQTIYTIPQALWIAYAGIETGTAQGGGASTITLRAAASGSNDFYKDQVVFLISGTGAGQTNRITSYVGSTQIATVETAWIIPPDNTTVYMVLGRVG